MEEASWSDPNLFFLVWCLNYVVSYLLCFLECTKDHEPVLFGELLDSPYQQLKWKFITLSTEFIFYIIYGLVAGSIAIPSDITSINL